MNEALVDDLLRGVSDWQSVPEIVRLTFKAVSDILRAQGNSLRELERQFPSRATKQEVHNALSYKLDSSELNNQLSDLKVRLDNRSLLLDIQARLDEKVNHTELAYYLSSKASIDDLNALNQSSLRDIEAASETFQSRLERLQLDTLKTSELHETRLLEEVHKNAVMFDTQIKQTEEKILGHLHKNIDLCQDQTKQVEEALLSSTHKHTVRLEDLVNQTEDRFGSYLQKLEDRMNGSLQKNMSNLEERFRNDLQKNISMTEDKLTTNLHKNSAMVEDKFGSSIQKNTAIIEDRIKQSEERFFTGLQKNSEYISALENKTNEIGRSLNNKTQELYQCLAESNRNIEEHTKEMQTQKREAMANKDESSSRLTQSMKENEAMHKQISDTLLQKTRELSYIIDERDSTLARSISALKEETGKFNDELSVKFQMLKNEAFTELKSLGGDISSIIKTLADLDTVKATKDEVNESYMRIASRIDYKAETNEVERELQMLKQEILNSSQDTSAGISHKIQRLEHDLTSKFTHMVSDKAETSFLQKSLVSKASIEDIHTLKQSLESIYSELNAKIPREELNRFTDYVKHTVDDMVNVNGKEFRALLEENNKQILEVHRRMERNSNELTQYISEQTFINEVLSGENTVGRWIWKSGRLRNGYAVPWDIQTVNTCPDNFIWERESTSIVVNTPGLYEIVFGFYSAKKPNVQLLVNGDPVFSAINSASYVVHHSSGRLKSVPHPSGNIAGLTLLDFIALPARASLSLSYSGDTHAEGFFGLRKI